MNDGRISGESPLWLKDFKKLAEQTGFDWVCPSDSRYPEARLIFNRFHNLYPAAITRTQDPTQIACILRFATEYKVSLAIRGGGHHVAGYGSCDQGIVIDFSPFRRVVVNTRAKTLEVEAGARLGDIDYELSRSGLVLPSGTVSKTGIAGLALGGGIGWLVGRHGLTCDQLIGADVVLATGELVLAEEPRHADLLWGLRGGGGNFGVVTRFRFRAFPMPSFTTGSGIVQLHNASLALRNLVDFMQNRCPRDLTIAPIFTHTGTGEPILSIDFCFANPDAATIRLLTTSVAGATWSITHEADFVQWQRAFDGLFEPPMRGYWKARYTDKLTTLDIDGIVNTFASRPTPRTNILVEHLHGAFANVGLDMASFPLRSARFGVLFSCRWIDPEDDIKNISWVRSSFATIDPGNCSGTYSNYAAAEDGRAISSFDPVALSRLLEIKHRYDPTNLFRRNHT